MEQVPTARWTLDVSVFHVDGFRHVLKAQTLGLRGGWVPSGEWMWKGIGIPAELLPDIQARLAAIVTEHLVTRYGVREELPFGWAGEAPIK